MSLENYKYKKNPPQACTLGEDVVCTTWITIITSRRGGKQQWQKTEGEQKKLKSIITDIINRPSVRHLQGNTCLLSCQ